MGKKSADLDTIPDDPADTGEAPEDPDPLDDGPKFVEGMRSPMDDPAHPLHHLRNA